MSRLLFGQSLADMRHRQEIDQHAADGNLCAHVEEDRQHAEEHVPDRIDLFRDTGSVFYLPGELFAENSWVQVMMGLGVTPRQHHPTADVMSEADLKRFLDDIRSHTPKNVEGLPAHMDYLRSYCPAPAPAR